MTNSIVFNSYFGSVPENAAIGTVLGEFSLTEPATGNVAFQIDIFAEGGDEQTHFAVNGTKLVLTSKLDYVFETEFYVSKYWQARATSDGQLIASNDGHLPSTKDVIDTRSGTPKADNLVGDVGMNKMLGGGGDDRLFAHGGDDILYGGIGRDVLSGGEGSDTFLFKAVKESTAKAPDILTAWDHTAGSATRDIIDLHTIDANTKIGGNQDFDWIGTNKFSGHAGELRYEKANGHTYVYADVNGDKDADFAIDIRELTKMYADDFLL